MSKKLQKTTSKPYTSRTLSCTELKKLYKMYKIRCWTEQFLVKRLMQAKECKSRKNFGLTKQQKELAEKAEKQHA